MFTLLTNISSLVTMQGSSTQARSGAAMQQIHEIRNGAMLLSDTIHWVGTTEEAPHKLEKLGFVADEVIHCTGKTIMPGFVDSHTHMVFAGNRSDEFARRLRGASYQEIAAEGGGILATMTSVRNSSVEELATLALPLLTSAMRHGTTAVEIKSGYGLNVESELKQLRAIRILRKELPMEIVPTFLGAHDIPPEYRSNREEYIRILCEEMIPAVAAETLAEYCDVFTDTGYYTIEESERIFRCAQEAGLQCRVHADELSGIGAAEMSARMSAVSADHLLHISDEGIDAMRAQGVIGTLLPGTAYTLGLPYAPARTMIDRGMAVALATDCNPGSCFSENMQTILSLACTQMKMTMEEALCAATFNGAAALQRSDRMGSLEPGKQANFIVMNVPRYTDLIYHFGVNHVWEVWMNGKKEIVNYYP